MKSVSKSDSLSQHTFAEGVKDGVPICLGYISVSFGFGILASNGGLFWLTALLISFTNVTSAGQLQGLSIMIANVTSAGQIQGLSIMIAGALLEMITAEFIINIRYALMSISLTQKLDRSFTTSMRLICGFGMTDEIFGVASGKEGLIGAEYMLGLISLPLLGWNLGTLMGALAGNVLPPVVQTCLGIMLYAMFIAIVLPPASKNRAVAFCAVIAMAVSCVLTYVPCFGFITGGFAVVVSALVASIPAALLFPVRTEEEGENNA